MTAKVIKEHPKAQNLSVLVSKTDILLRLHQAIEANVPIVTGLDPSILENMADTGFAPMAHWELMAPDNNYFVKE